MTAVTIVENYKVTGSNTTRKSEKYVKVAIFRSLQLKLESHSKLVCTVVDERCHGLGLSLVALSDFTVASETATFELTAFKGAPLLPGAAALTARALSQSLVSAILGTY